MEGVTWEGRGTGEKGRGSLSPQCYRCVDATACVIVLLFIRAPVYVLLVFIGMCSGEWISTLIGRRLAIACL